MNKLIILFFVLSALLCHAQINLLVTPTNQVIHLNEPAIFEVAVLNTSPSDVVGLFVLNGAYHGFEIDIARDGSDTTKRFYNSVMKETAIFDMMFHPVTIEPHGLKTTHLCMLYNMLTDSYVFDMPGEYTIVFRLLWDSATGAMVSAKARVTVLEWESSKDARQIEALKLWNDRRIAAAFQDDNELRTIALERVNRLASVYPETNYGKLALTILKGTKGTELKEQPRQQETEGADFHGAGGPRKSAEDEKLD